MKLAHIVWDRLTKNQKKLFMEEDKEDAKTLSDLAQMPPKSLLQAIRDAEGG